MFCLWWLQNAFLKVQLLFRDNGLYWYPAMTRVQTGDCAQEVIVAWLNDIMARPGCVPCVSSEVGQSMAVSDCINNVEMEDWILRLSVVAVQLASCLNDCLFNGL